MDNETLQNQPTAEPDLPENDEKPAIKIKYKITEQDFMTQMDFMIKKTVSGMKLKSRFMLCVSDLLIVLLLAMIDWRGYLPIIIFLSFMSVLLLGLNQIFVFILRMANAKNVKERRKAGEFDSPIEASFYPDRMTVTGSATHSVFQWNEMTGAYEVADGLYIVHQQYRYFYIPARFFDKNTSAVVTDILQQSLGKKFSRDAQMNLPETAENPGEAVKPAAEEGEPAFRYDFAMTGKDMTAVSGRSSRIMLAAVGAVIAAICGSWAYGSIKNGNTYYAVLAVLVCVIMIVVFVSTYNKKMNAANFPTKNISLRWYGDHVTVVTYQEDEATNLVPYSKLKKIKRQGNLTVMLFKDNTFLYVPQSSFSDDAERAKFEEFLKEKIIKYFKQ